MTLLRGKKKTLIAHPRIDYRIQAAKELLNRGWGRVPESEGAEVRTIALVLK